MSCTSWTGIYDHIQTIVSDLNDINFEMEQMVPFYYEQEGTCEKL